MKWLFAAEAQPLALEILIFLISEALGASRACCGGRFRGAVFEVWELFGEE